MIKNVMLKKMLSVVIVVFHVLAPAQTALATTSKVKTSTNISQEQLVATLNDPIVKKDLSKLITTRYENKMNQWFTDLSNTAKKEKTLESFIYNILGQENTLTTKDREYIHSIFKNMPAPQTTKIIDGIEFQSFKITLSKNFGEVLFNGKPVEAVNFSQELQNLIEGADKKSGFLPNKSRLDIVSRLVIPQAEAVVPLIAVALQVFVRHVVIGAATGAALGAVTGTMAGCIHGINNKSDNQSLSQSCGEGAKFGTKTLATAFAAGGGVFALSTLWHGDGGMFWWRNRDISPDEIPKLRNYLKLGGGIAVLSAIYDPIKSTAEGYGVQLICSTNGWRLLSMKAGKIDSVIATDSCIGPNLSICENENTVSEKLYLEMLANKGVPETGRSLLAKQLALEHKERTDFCLKNPGKVESSIFSKMKSEHNRAPHPKSIKTNDSSVPTSQ